MRGFHRVAGLLGTALLVSASASGQASAAGLQDLEGKWTSDVTHEPIWFSRAFGGYDALISWFGQTSISESGGYAGSHIKVSGGANLVCYYYVSINDKRRMEWSLRAGDQKRCPPSSAFHRDP
jgi:hypothetical protein